MSYPEVFILGRQVDGVYVEYLHGAEKADLFFDYTIARDERNHMNKTNTKDGEWRILKYGMRNYIGVLTYCNFFTITSRFFANKKPADQWLTNVVVSTFPK